MKTLLTLFTAILFIQSCAGSKSDYFELKNDSQKCYVRKSDGVPFGVNGELWSVRLESGRSLTPDHFAEVGVIAPTILGDSVLLFRYSDSLNTIILTMNLGQHGLDCRIVVEKLEEDVFSIALPSRLDIDTAALKYVIFPNELGVKLKKSFYLAQPNPKIWSSQPIGTEPLKIIAGIECFADPAVNTTSQVRLTPLAIKALDKTVAQIWHNTPRRAVRPATTAPQYNFIDSDKGSFWGGHKIGNGVLLRYAGKLTLSEVGDILSITSQTVDAFGKGLIDGFLPKSRHIIGLIDIPQCPKSTGWSEISVDQWRKYLSANNNFVSLTSIEQLLEFILADGSLAVINPYGEILPTGSEDNNEIYTSIKRYLTDGGIWVETGGYSFFNTLTPQTYNSLSTTYPFAFSDFMEINYGKHNIIVCGVQPNDDFIPINLRTWADSLGGHVSREWRQFIDKNKGGSSHTARFVFDRDIKEAIEQYADDNAFTKPLSEKMPAQTLEKWKQAMLIKFSGRTINDQTAKIPTLPSPSIVHVWDYVKGGFDKLYPEHLPPHPSRGTMADFERLIDTTHTYGHLFMPYTNNTWWCDAPAAEVLTKYGSEALFKDRQGNRVKEDYAGNYGWSISPHHPKVIEAAEEIASQFSDLDCDILFEDQVGAREWIGMDFNAASPHPSAYYQGVINLATTASAYRPLATEQGYDRLINNQSEFCGLTWMLVPFKERPWWVSWWLRSYSDLFDEADYEAYPLAQYVARGNTLFTHHLGGPLVETSENLAWTLLLGYQIIVDMSTYHEITPERQSWINMLSKIQNHFGPLYMGQKMESFYYLAGSGNSGVIESRFENMSVVANFSEKPYKYNGYTIAPKGFLAESETWMAGYITEKGVNCYILIDKKTNKKEKYEF